MTRIPLSIVAMAACIVGLYSCAPGSETSADHVTLKLNRLANGDLEYCDENGECQTLPYDGDCDVVEVSLDPATGQTCERCVLDDGTVINNGCEDASIGCVLVTLPDPDCVVCAYINGAVVYSTCTAEVPECYRDSDCRSADGVQGLCVDGQCIFEPECTSDADCPRGFICEFDDQTMDPSTGPIARGICKPRPTECRVDADCPEGMYCDQDCWEGPIDCDPNTGTDCRPTGCHGVCLPLPPTGCEDITCAIGEHCEVICLADAEGGANSDVPCIDGSNCGCRPVCVPDQTRCLEDADCPDGLVCRIGPCPMMPCYSEDGDPDNTVCPPCYGECVPPEPPECYSDLDCPSGFFCDLQPYPCEPGMACPDVMVGVCVPIQPRECWSDLDCPEGFVCELDGTISPDNATNLVAPRGVCVPEEPKPIECWSDLDCPRGFVCEFDQTICSDGTYCLVARPGICVPVTDPNECSSDRPCPYGYECVTMCWDCIPEDPTCEPGCKSECVRVEPPDPCEGFLCPDGQHCEVACYANGDVAAPCVPGDPNCGGCGPVCVPDPTNDCMRTGCSREICADQPMESICIWEPWYACLDFATCERQADGACGWTMTDEARMCVAGNDDEI